MEYVPEIIKQAMPTFNDLKRRISTLSSSEPFLLPPENFRVSSDEKLAGLFLQLRRRERLWDDQLPELHSETVTGKQLPRNLHSQARKKVYVDSRNLYFPVDRGAHGLLRELDDDCESEERQRFLRSAFRFGAPIGDGFHHDAQFIGRDLDGVTFECCQNGDVEGTGSHANIYPNDYVRL